MKRLPVLHNNHLNFIESYHSMIHIFLHKLGVRWIWSIGAIYYKSHIVWVIITITYFSTSKIVCNWRDSNDRLVFNSKAFLGSWIKGPIQCTIRYFHICQVIISFTSWITWTCISREHEITWRTSHCIINYTKNLSNWWSSGARSYLN